MVAGAHLRRPRSVVLVHARFFHGDCSSKEMDAQEESSLNLFWIRTLCHQGQLGQAINFLYNSRTSPHVDVYLFLLKACNHQKSLSQARRVHAHLARYDILLSGFLGDYLVMTLARCGALEDALDLFFELSDRTVYSWTAIISACSECSHGEHAYVLHQYMIADGIQPDACTFVCLLKACGCSLDFHFGKELHSDACSKGLAADVYVGNTLISMYGKFASLEEAENVFRGLISRNIVSWCTMLTVHVDQGCGDRALQLYRQMLEEGIQPDRLASMVALKACGLLADNEEYTEMKGLPTMQPLAHIGQAIHADACRKGFVLDAYLTSALLNMYGKVGLIVDAEHSFQALSEWNIVIWNAMLSAYIEQGLGEKILFLYRQMYHEGFSPDQLTILTTLQACGILACNEDLHSESQLCTRVCAEIGQALHADACKRGFAFDAVLGSALLYMYGKCKALMQMDFVFASMSEHNIVAWNGMLTIYIDEGQHERALLLYRQLQEERVGSDELSFAISLQACSALVEKYSSGLETQPQKAMVIEIGCSLHADTRRRGLVSCLSIGNALLKFYTNCRYLTEAEQVFDAMPKPNLVSWNVVLRAYVDSNQEVRALQFFAHMQRHLKIHDDVTLISIWQACSTFGSLEIARCLHFHTVSVEFEKMPSVAATAIHAYGCCASMVDAHAFFDAALPDCHVALWNACVAGYAGDGNYVTSYYFFEMFKLAGLTPSVITFTSLLSACSRCGLPIEAAACFESMRVDFDLNVDAKHIGIMVDLLGRTGDFRRIDDMFAWIETLADLSIFISLLGSCRVHGNSELAVRVFDCAIKVYPDEASLYILMSNIFADVELQRSCIQFENDVVTDDC